MMFKIFFLFVLLISCKRAEIFGNILEALANPGQCIPGEDNGGSYPTLNTTFPGVNIQGNTPTSGCFIDQIYSDFERSTANYRTVYSPSKKRDETLAVDIYEPLLDPRPLRPAIVVLYGGAFHEWGQIVDKRHCFVLKLANAWVRRGYVVFSADYRNEFSTKEVLQNFVDFRFKKDDMLKYSPQLRQSAIRAEEDIYALLQWIHNSAASKYRVDKTRIAMTGFSSGACISLNLATKNYSTKVRAVVDIGGITIPDTSAVSQNDPPIFRVIGLRDTTISFALNHALCHKAFRVGADVTCVTDDAPHKGLPNVFIANQANLAARWLYEKMNLGPLTGCCQAQRSCFRLDSINDISTHTELIVPPDPYVVVYANDDQSNAFRTDYKLFATTVTYNNFVMCWNYPFYSITVKVMDSDLNTDEVIDIVTISGPKAAGTYQWNFPRKGHLRGHLFNDMANPAQLGLSCVHIDRATVPNTDVWPDTSDPYIEVFPLGLPAQAKKTATINSNLNPVFNQQFCWATPIDQFTYRVWDADTLNKDDLVAQGDIDIRTLGSTFPKNFNVNFNGGSLRGSVTFQNPTGFTSTCSPPANVSIPPTPPPTEKYITTVTIISGSNLPDKDALLAGDSDPFVEVQAIDLSNVIQKTTTVNNNHNPTWNQKFSFLARVNRIKIIAYDEDPSPLPAEKLGEATFDITSDALTQRSISLNGGGSISLSTVRKHLTSAPTKKPTSYPSRPPHVIPVIDRLVAGGSWAPTSAPSQSSTSNSPNPGTTTTTTGGTTTSGETTAPGATTTKTTTATMTTAKTNGTAPGTTKNPINRKTPSVTPFGAGVTCSIRVAVVATVVMAMRL